MKRNLLVSSLRDTDKELLSSVFIRVIRGEKTKRRLVSKPPLFVSKED
jgi:hypothetical protein